MGRKLDKETKQNFFPTLNQNKTITKQSLLRMFVTFKIFDIGFFIYYWICLNPILTFE